MNNNYQNMNPNTNLNDYLNGTQGQVNNQPVVNQNMNMGNQAEMNQNMNNMGMNNVPNTNGVNYNNSMPMNQQPKKNNSMMIVIIVVALLLVGVGGFVVFKAFSGGDDTNSNGNVDIKNQTDYLETKTDSAGEVAYSYAYNDYKTGTSYSSTDKVTWYKEAVAGTESVNLDDLILKINSKSPDVTSLGNGKYEVEMKVDETGAVPGSVPVEVQVTNGFITHLVYDFTSIYSMYGYSKYVITMDLSDFNTSGDVVIPANVISGATYEVEDDL